MASAQKKKFLVYQRKALRETKLKQNMRRNIVFVALIVAVILQVAVAQITVTDCMRTCTSSVVDCFNNCKIVRRTVFLFLM